MYYFPVSPRNRLTSAKLETVLSHTEKCIASYYRQFSTNIKIKMIKSIQVLFARPFGPLEITKLGLIFEFFISISAESYLWYDAINSHTLVTGSQSSSLETAAFFRRLPPPADWGRPVVEVTRGDGDEGGLLLTPPWEAPYRGGGTWCCEFIAPLSTSSRVLFNLKVFLIFNFIFRLGIHKRN